MGRQNNDQKVVGSSIVLLQERFRQLQRIKEKREERELLKLFVDPIQNKMSFSSSKNDFQDPLALGLNLYGTNTEDFESLDTQQQQFSGADFRVPCSFEITDVDTSLHL
ncbi:Hypothetical predicted protein [Olea europaea subsp. europaea]|uniref:Uncharacterized protein n=1 Tax=Olea europaea subsp. europaea TaxID=158383 RepID=A0A8S0PMC4_OLEEU|nr:Hypothetical predicted protein [Olea europaea subsp. europaea]